MAIVAPKNGYSNARVKELCCYFIGTCTCYVYVSVSMDMPMLCTFEGASVEHQIHHISCITCGQIIMCVCVCRTSNMCRVSSVYQSSQFEHHTENSSSP